MVSPESTAVSICFYLGAYIGIVMKSLAGVPPRDRSANKGQARLRVRMTHADI